MTIENFLSFWNLHNTSIIEGLVALIVILSLFLGYRSLFAKKSADGDLTAAGHVDASQLEKTLQKILESQGQASGSEKAPRASLDVAEDIDLDIESEGGAKSAPTRPATANVSAESAATSSAEVEQLRAHLADSQKKLESMQTQLSAAQAQGAAAAADAAAAPEAEGAVGGISAQEKADLEGKVRDLEARLSEYEIISEDIADLSRYKEENEKLRTELETLKTATSPGSGAAAMATATEVVTGAAVEANLESALASQVAPQVAAVNSAPTPQPQPEVAAEAPASEGASLIDDELMKEFAAAVEGQKAASTEPASVDLNQEKSDGTESLMNDFENFVSKKS